MSNLMIEGGRRLSGSLPVYGAKNAILPILAACIMTEEEVVLESCPVLSDVANMLEILRLLGCSVAVEGDVIRINAKHANRHEMPTELSKKMRSSIFMLGALISRFGKAWVTQPGGCEIGLRPIDLHLKGLRALNVSVDEEHGEIQCNGPHTKGAEITLDYPSVGATENIIMAAVTAEGKTVLHNAAREPEVSDLARFINQMGGRIKGAGAGTIEIIGVKRLQGTRYKIMPDRIVAGTYLAAAAVTGGDVTLTGICPEHLQAAASKLQETGCLIQFTEDTVRIQAPRHLGEMQKIETLPYPGFPTDLQAQFMAVACVCHGTCILSENVFENRFKHVPELCRMGARIQIKERTAVVRGGTPLMGAEVAAKDLRGGAALVIAGLAAKGRTTVEGKCFIDRGYQDLAAELSALGAEIR